MSDAHFTYRRGSAYWVQVLAKTVAAGGEDTAAGAADRAGAADVEVVVLPVADGADRVRPQAPVEDAELVVVDPRRDPGGCERVDGGGELVLIAGRVGPHQRRVRAGQAGHLQSHQRDLGDERQVACDEYGQAAEHRDGVPLDD